ncbi:hypothetical protein LINPERHAP1_LOCUS9589, partial [Linum perenne]
FDGGVCCGVVVDWFWNWVTEKSTKWRVLNQTERPTPRCNGQRISGTISRFSINIVSIFPIPNHKKFRIYVEF